MKIKLTRESVCAADDCLAPHDKTISVPNSTTISDLAKIIQQDYLPRIQGGKATWSLVTDIPVAVLAQQWKEPEILPQFEIGEPKSIDQYDISKMHVNYHAQLDPKVVVEVLRDLKLETIQQ